jgi:hypothetical protein
MLGLYLILYFYNPMLNEILEEIFFFLVFGMREFCFEFFIFWRNKSSIFLYRVHILQYKSTTEY